MRILLIGSNGEPVSLLKTQLLKNTVLVDAVQTIEEADTALRILTYDAVVLDLELSNEEGLALALRMRQRRSSPPLLVLSACLEVKDRVAALRSGAADYLTKPFEMVELVARLQALVRRPPEIRDRTIVRGDVWLQVDRQQLKIEKTTHQLSRHEIVLLEALLTRPGHVVPNSVLRARLFGGTAESDSNALEVSMHRLRRRLVRTGAALHVQTVRGVGYVLQMKG